MRVALYLRESSADTTKAPDIKNQEERGRQWAKENGHEIVKVYRDNGYSGGDWNRPAWNESVKHSRGHMFRILWVWNQDRIARDTEQFLWYYRMMKDATVKIYDETIQNYIDMETLQGRISHQSLAQSAEIFRLLTGEKVKRSYERNKAQGKPWGRKSKKLTKEIQDKIHELRKNGWGYRTIATHPQVQLNYQKVRRYLQQETK